MVGGAKNYYSVRSDAGPGGGGVDGAGEGVMWWGIRGGVDSTQGRPISMAP